MGRKPQRIVEAAIIERIGPVTAQELMTMSDDSWGLIRDQITDPATEKTALSPDVWRECEVYIRASKPSGIARPLFQHYNGSDPDCPWFQSRNIKPDDARAAQYRGKQETNFHRLMCELVGELAALDSSYINHTVDQYRPPTENEHGRYPDTYVEWEGFGPFVVEFQMPGTFQTEISARCKHFEREGIPLLWILFGLDTAAALPQSFIDVIRRHRGNAFVLDQVAVAASREQKTLVLSCYLRKLDGELTRTVAPCGCGIRADDRCHDPLLICPERQLNQDRATSGGSKSSPPRNRPAAMLFATASAGTRAPIAMQRPPGGQRSLIDLRASTGYGRQRGRRDIGCYHGRGKSVRDAFRNSGPFHRGSNARPLLSPDSEPTFSCGTMHRSNGVDAKPPRMGAASLRRICRAAKSSGISDMLRDSINSPDRQMAFPQQMERNYGSPQRTPSKFALIARTLPEAHMVEDPRILAWEILRRRSDYQGAKAGVEHVQTSAGLVQLITTRGGRPSGGLRFRRDARVYRCAGEPVLVPRC